MLTVVVVCGVLACQSESPAALHTVLVERAGRLFEARLSGTPFEPCKRAERGRCAVIEVRSGDLATVLRRVRHVTNNGSSHLADHLKSVRDALTDPDGSLLETINHLQGVVLRAPHHARGHNDLAVLLLLHAQQQGSPWFAVRALEEVDAALALEPMQAEARFNRALLLDFLHLRTEARRAWEAYLELDAKSFWSDEVRRRLQDRASLTRRETWEASRDDVLLAAERGDRRRVEAAARDLTQELFFDARDRLLPAWAAGRADQVDPVPSTAAMRLIADVLAEQTGDTLLADVLRERHTYDTASGMLAYTEGLAHYHASCFADARARLGEGLRSLGPAHPMRSWLSFFDAVSLMQLDTGAGAHALRQLLAHEAWSRYPILRGRVQWVLGVAVGRSNQLEASLAHYRAARAHLGDALGLAATASVDFVIGEASGLRGQRLARWRSVHVALDRLSMSGDHRRWHSLLRSMGRSLVREGLVRAGRSFLDEAVTNAEEWGDSYGLTASYLERGKARALLGEAGAADDWTRAASAAEGLRCDTRFHRSVVADLALARAAVDLRDAPAKVAQSLDDAIASYEARDEKTLRSRALVARAAAHRALGQTQLARKALSTATTWFREQRAASNRPEPLAVSEAELATARLVALELDAGDALAALTASEQFRPVPVGRLLTPEAVRALVKAPPSDRMIILFQDLEDHVILWRLDAGGLETFEVGIHPQDLQDRVARAWASIRDGAEDQESILRQLYEELFLEALAGVDTERLVIVGDRSVAALPFAALLDPATGQFLIERFTVSVAHTLAAAVMPIALPTSGTVLAIGAPSASPSSTIVKADLPAARREAEGVAMTYSDREVVLWQGDEATRERFRDQWWRHSIVHIAAHSTIDPYAPHRWILHLASDDGHENGDLTATHLEAFSGRLATELMILSSCSSALDGSAISRAPFGIAGAFVAAGVPAVIGALWHVDDATTASLMGDLHGDLARGIDPAVALARAQRQAIIRNRGRGEATAGDWSAFRLLVGSVFDTGSIEKPV